jgi:post-segregation antitoxin (ccd killing protein)
MIIHLNLNKEIIEACKLAGIPISNLVRVALAFNANKNKEIFKMTLDIVKKSKSLHKSEFRRSFAVRLPEEYIRILRKGNINASDIVNDSIINLVEKLSSTNF